MLCCTASKNEIYKVELKWNYSWAPSLWPDSVEKERQGCDFPTSRWRRPIVSCLIFCAPWHVPAVRQEEQQEPEGGTNAPRDDGDDDDGMIQIQDSSTFSCLCQSDNNNFEFALKQLMDQVY